MKTSILFTVGLIAFCPFTFAHEGHDHDAPVQIVAPKGGVIRTLEKTNVEAVTRLNMVEIYLYDKTMKPLPVAGFVVSAMAELPRTRKLEKVDLVSKDHYLQALFDAKSLHRYTLLVTIKDPKTGHDDRLKFTIEPHKK
jgi:hypothetical protein